MECLKRQTNCLKSENESIWRINIQMLFITITGGIFMSDFKISYIGDNNVGNVHHIGIDYNGNYYSVIFGRYVNGGFFSIPNWNCGGELSTFDDVFWNAESIGRSLKK